MYVGFIPENRKVEKQPDLLTDTKIECESVDVKLISSPKEFDEYYETADKNTTVYVTVGDETIKTTSNSKGKWTIELKTKIARKAKISAYAENSVGCRSKVQKYTVR